MPEPLISCLMVTLPAPARFERLKQNLASYAAQTYPRRELVMVIDGRLADASITPQIKAHVAALGRDDIRIVEPVGALSLGALRNISMASAHGDVTCQWDDDDLNHPQRLERQLADIVQSGGEANCLQHVMQFVAAPRDLYCTNWIWTPERGHPATLMRRSSAPVVYPEVGERSQLGEDMEAIAQLQARGGYGVLADAPHLYVYVSHGANAYDEEHHQWLFKSLAISRGLLQRREAALREAMAVFDFGPGPVTVQGSNGPAFTLT